MTVRDFEAADFRAVCRIYIDAKRDELKFEPDPVEVAPLEQDEAIYVKMQRATKAGKAIS